jgi:hypothetical protein
MERHLSVAGRRLMRLPPALLRWVLDIVAILSTIILVMETGGRLRSWVSFTIFVLGMITDWSIAVSLLRKIKEAVAECNDHKFLHHQFVLGLPEASVKKWEGELGEWEEDHTKPNPFEKQFKGMSFRCRLFLLTEDMLPYSLSYHSGCSS